MALPREKTRLLFVVISSSFGRITIALVLAAALAFLIAAVAMGIPGNIERVSTDSAGSQGNGPSFQPSTSADGRYVAFKSRASNLVAGDTNGTDDIFVKDTQTNRTVRVSTDSAGAQGNGPSEYLSISADGRYVAFGAQAFNLVPGDTNGANDIFVKDTQTNRTVRVSTDSAGLQGNGLSFQPSISADGRFVAFVSRASNLVPGDTNGTYDIFVKDTQTNRTVMVSSDSAGAQGNGQSYWPSISADGRNVAFHSVASNLVAGDTNGTYDIFVKDTQTNRTVMVSSDSAGAGGDNGASDQPSISADGRYVAFESMASNLVPGDINGTMDIFVKDTQTNRTVRVSTDSTGSPGNGQSNQPSISVDGRYVAFRSVASNLVDGDNNGAYDIFVKDTRTNRTVRVSTDSAGSQGNGLSFQPSISADGRIVAFGSEASNLVAGDTNGAGDIFVKDVGSFLLDNTPPQVTYLGPTGTIYEGSATISASYTDPAPSSGTDAASAYVRLNGGASQPCTASGGTISCQVSGLTYGDYSAQVFISDNAGNTGSATGAFQVCTSGFGLSEDSEKLGCPVWSLLH